MQSKCLAHCIISPLSTPNLKKGPYFFGLLSLMSSSIWNLKGFFPNIAQFYLLGFVYFIFCSDRDQSWSLTHARQVLDH